MMFEHFSDEQPPNSPFHPINEEIQRLHRYEQRYHALMEAAAPLTWIANADGQVEEDLPAWRAHTGQSARAIKGHGWLDALHPEDRAQLLRFWSQPLSAQTRYEARQRIRRANGAYHTFLVRALPVRTASGDIREWVGLCTEINGQQEVEAASGQLLQHEQETYSNELALREANRRMDEFLGIASHELKTPLTSLIMSIQMAERRVHALAQQASASDTTQPLTNIEQMLGRAAHQTRLLNRLVTDLLDVSRIHAGKLDLSRELTDLRTIVRDAVEQERQVAPKRTITLQAPEQPVPALADAVRIGEVITNYLTNALKYSAESAPVAAGITIEDTQARVWVRDEGAGLSSEQQQFLWERFYRAPGVKVQSGSGVGLGLGLYISRTIIERHQGQVGVQTAPGKGSTFWFTLPLAQQKTQAAEDRA